MIIGIKNIFAEQDMLKWYEKNNDVLYALEKEFKKHFPEEQILISTEGFGM